MTPQLQAALAAMKSTDGYALARANALVTVYDEQWSPFLSEFDVLGAEIEFHFPLLNPETESPSRTFEEAGKIDVLVRHKATKALKVVEHKTTADDVGPESHYWDRLRMDPQCSKYYLAAMQMNLGEVGSVIYDVIGKPAHRPSQIPTLDADGFKIVLDASGQRVMTKDGKKPRETGDTERGWVVQGKIETPDQFQARLLSVLRAAPGDYFAQREVPRLDSDILEFMADDWNISQQILYYRKHGIWPRNPQACTQYGTCEYFDLCCGRASVDGVRFGTATARHAELKIQGTADKQLLTNSRSTALRKCARFHKLRYEDKTERIGEVSEALALGTLVHLGLEAYYISQKAKTP